MQIFCQVSLHHYMYLISVFSWILGLKQPYCENVIPQNDILAKVASKYSPDACNSVKEELSTNVNS